jgi:hypothetical protein
VPWDLSEWVDPASLERWIREEIDALDWSNSELIAFLHAHPAYRPKQLFYVLTYAYATGVFESHEVLSVCYTHPHLRALCEGQPPEATELSRFRRENRGLLRWAVSQVLRRAVREKFGLGDALLPAGLRRHLFDHATERLDLARHMDRAGHGE